MTAQERVQCIWVLKPLLLWFSQTCILLRAAQQPELQENS